MQRDVTLHYIIAIGIFQALIAAGLLLGNKLRSSADSLLILFVFCIASHLAIKFLIYNFVGDFQVRHQMNTFLGLCYGPLLYLYTLKTANSSFVPISRWYVFIPFFLGSIAYFTVAGVIFFSKASGYPLLKWYNNISAWAIMACNLYCVCASLKVRQKAKGTISLKDRKLTALISYCFLVLTVFPVPFYLFQNLQGGDTLPTFVRSFTYATMAVLCVMIIYYRYVAGNSYAGQAISLQGKNIAPESFNGEAIPKNKHSSREVTDVLLRKSSWPEQRLEEIWVLLEAHMQNKNVFMDADLSLDKMAAATKINKYHISETLNSYAQKSFYQYVNEYRIRYAIGQMEVLSKSDMQINFMSLAYAAGFKAKSSFNRYFKEITGSTPTEHLKFIQNGLLAG